MTWLFIGIAIVIIVIVVRRNKVPTVTLDKITADLQSNGVLIDVRSPGEFKANHARGAQNISLQAMQSGSLPSGDKSRPVYLYCHSGARASAAARLMRLAGFTNVINLGGLSAWKRLGGAVVR